MKEKTSALENLIGLTVLVMVGAQTWIVLNDATDGEVGRRVSRWCSTSLGVFFHRLQSNVVRCTTWIDAPAITARMVAEEIEPLLRGEA